MEKNIKDYLHLYLGCELWEEGNNKGELLGYVNFGGIWNVHTNCSSNEPYWSNASLYKLILRPLSDMTEEEKENCIRPNHVLEAAEMTLYLLYKHFDLFGLIEAGIAIDKTKIQNHER